MAGPGGQYSKTDITQPGTGIRPPPMPRKTFPTRYVVTSLLFTLVAVLASLGIDACALTSAVGIELAPCRPTTSAPPASDAPSPLQESDAVAK